MLMTMFISTSDESRRKPRVVVKFHKVLVSSGGRTNAVVQWFGYSCTWNLWSSLCVGLSDLIVFSGQGLLPVVLCFLYLCPLVSWLVMQCEVSSKPGYLLCRSAHSNYYYLWYILSFLWFRKNCWGLCMPQDGLTSSLLFLVGLSAVLNCQELST